MVDPGKATQPTTNREIGYFGEQQALSLDPDRVPDFLEERCAGNDILRREVEAMLAAAGDTPFFTGALAAQIDRLQLEETDRLPGHIGPYTILERLGRGGMGTASP